MSPLRPLLSVLGWTLALWLLMALATLPVWPLHGAQRPMDLSRPYYMERGVSSQPPSIFTSEFQEAVYEIARNCPLPPKRRIILLGGSGSQGFETGPLRAATGADEVLNLSMLFSNFTAMRQTYHDVRVCLGDGIRQTSFIVIPSLANFVANNARSAGPYTYYEKEKLRSHLFRGPVGAVEPIVDPRWMPWLVELWRPVIAARKLTYDSQAEAYVAKLWVKQHLFHRVVPSLGPLNREQSLHFIEMLEPDAGDPGSFAPEQTAELERLFADIRGDGSTVLLAEQPTQAWFREQSRVYPPAHRQFGLVTARDAVPYIDLSETAADSEFHDPVHPNAEGADLWTRRLVEALAGLRRADPAVLGPGAPAPARIAP